jgi:hypothetical protein
MNAEGGHEPRWFESRRLREIFFGQGGRGYREWRRLHNEELYHLYF